MRALRVAAAAAAVAVAALVILINRHAGTSGTTSGGTTPTVVSVAAAPAGGVRAGVAAPAFQGTAVDGSTIDLAALRGRVVVINFFATWCSNCREEEPRLQALATADAGRGLTVIGINYRETGDAVSFLRGLGVSYPAVLDPQSRIGQAYGVDDLPVTVYVDRAGVVARVIHGQLTDTTLDGVVAQMLG